MRRFKNAIVRTPCHAMVKGLTSADLGVPKIDLALRQHEKYVRTLQLLGLQVLTLPPDNDHPDSTFVEDTALITEHFALITNPGAASRKGETVSIRRVLSDIFSNLDAVTPPGTLDAGDVMEAGDVFFIGLSERTNREGAEQVCRILSTYKIGCVLIEVKKGLHLKSGLNHLPPDIILATPEFSGLDELKRFEVISVPQEESYAANSLWINGSVLVPEGYPQTAAAIRARGYEVKALDISEFRKMDGGLSCLSLRY